MVNIDRWNFQSSHFRYVWERDKNVQLIFLVFCDRLMQKIGLCKNLNLDQIQTVGS